MIRDGKYATLTAFSHETGDTIRERRVAAWFVHDVGPDERDNGVYVSLSSTEDLQEEISEVGLGVTITEDVLLKLGYVYLPSTAAFVAENPGALDEPTEPEPAELEYVKVF